MEKKTANRYKDYEKMAGIWVRPYDWKLWQGYVVTADHKEDGRKFKASEAWEYIRAYWKRSPNRLGALIRIIARTLTLRLRPSQAPALTTVEKCIPPSGLTFLCGGEVYKILTTTTITNGSVKDILSMCGESCVNLNAKIHIHA